MSALLAVPNVSEGRDTTKIEAIARAFGPGLLDVHSDPDHHRSVFTVAGDPGSLADPVLAGAQAAMAAVDLGGHQGIHPRVGAVDVAPIVYLTESDRGAACAEALVLADLLGEEASVPVFLYGILAGGRTRAQLRRGGPRALSDRVERGELSPDFGPLRIDPRKGAVLVAARPLLVAFNVELAPPTTLTQAEEIAALIREGGSEGLPGVRAIGLWLAGRQRAQVSVNVEDHRTTPLVAVLRAIQEHARVSETELVGLAPVSAFDGFPDETPVRNRRTLEDRLGG